MEELNVKVGDKVLYYYGFSYNRVEKIATVTKITPTGRIRIDVDNCQYNKYGDAMGRMGAWDSASKIRQYTEDGAKRIIESNTILKAVSLCSKVNRKDLTYEQALKIIEILEDSK